MRVLLNIADSVGSRPVTRAASKQNYAAQPITAIRNNFEKPRGHLGKHKSTKDADGTMDLEDDAFADVHAVHDFPTVSSTEHRYIGSSTRSNRIAPVLGTPVQPKFAP